MENKLEEVERDYIEFRKEMEEEENTKSNNQLKKSNMEEIRK
jgi:hypothetical protein